MTEPVGDDPDTGDDTVLEQLDDADTLDNDPRSDPEDPLDEGISPNERPWGLDAWGVTEEEEREGEPLDDRLRREVPDTTDEGGDGLGDAADTDGELRDDEVGDARSGRLVADGDGDGYAVDEWAEDVGIDGAGASAEEAAVHTIPDPGDEN